MQPASEKYLLNVNDEQGTSLRRSHSRPRGDRKKFVRRGSASERRRHEQQKSGKRLSHHENDELPILHQIRQFEPGEMKKISYQNFSLDKPSRNSILFVSDLHHRGTERTYRPGKNSRSHPGIGGARMPIVPVVYPPYYH